jgi:hypothetical protein
MLVQFVPEKMAFKAGEPVTAKLRLTNVGQTDFAFIEGGRQRGPRDNQFAFSAELVGSKMMPDTGDPTTRGGKGIPIKVKHAQSYEIVVDLAKWFTFNETGTYKIRGSYQMDFVDPRITEWLDTIWEDFACAEFSIEIER